jgi:hypothetical protein
VEQQQSKAGSSCWFEVQYACSTRSASGQAPCTAAGQDAGQKKISRKRSRKQCVDNYTNLECD